ncbi:MAG: NAD-dependent epimerase/dehydratase family protein [Rhodothalassiaceae bacterium]
MPAEPAPPPLQPGDRIALTGATGFLGGYVMDALLAAGLQLTALARRPQPERAGVRWVEGHINDQQALIELVRDAHGLIHAAGIVQARRKVDFLVTNMGGTARLALTASIAEAPVRRAILISSLAAREPRLSAYAASKRAAEHIWHTLPEATRSVIVRPPAIYGPGDTQVIKLIEAAQRGWLPAPAGRNARFSLIHAADVAAATVALLTAHELPEAPVELSDPTETGYSMDEVAGLIGARIGQRPRLIPLPRWLVRLAGLANETAGLIRGRTVFFTHGKAREVTHKDWVAQAPGNRAIHGWQPRIDLSAGLDTITDETTGQKRP